MLARQKRRRDDHGNLGTVHCGDEGCAQRHFRFAEADVAPDQAIHGPAGAEIIPHRVDGAGLIFRFVIGEAGGKFVVEAVRRNQCRGMPGQALGCDADQALGHIEQPLLELGLAHLPCAAAQLVELRLTAFGAIARQKIDVFDRQKQLGIVGVLQLETGMRGAGSFDRLQADEAADAVFGVDDDRAFVKAGDFRDEIGIALVALRTADHAVAEDILLADDHDLPTWPA